MVEWLVLVGFKGCEFKFGWGGLNWNFNKGNFLVFVYLIFLVWVGLY